MNNDSKPLFVVSDEHELLTLWRLVAEAKFRPDPEDTDLWDSPYVYSLTQRIDDARFDCAKRLGDVHARRHVSWRSSLASNVVLPVVMMHLKNKAASAEWKCWTAESKTNYLRASAAPFEVSSALAARLIAEAESFLKLNETMRPYPRKDQVEAMYDGSAICVRVVGSHGDPVDLAEHEVESFIDELRNCLAKARA